MECTNYFKRKKEIEEEINSMKNRLQEKERELNHLIQEERKHNLSNSEILRYSRQIIVPEIGVKGQEKLLQASVLIVGCGGLGCPAGQYLAGAGIGKLGLVDYDCVEENNLHRQVLHSEKTLGQTKVSSMAESLSRLNSQIEIAQFAVQLSSSNALDIVSNFDIVIDASDNPATRYLVNDACILAGKPLISGSAVKTEGQLTVYNSEDGPCYRCLFPVPTPASAVANCSDLGVLGPGVIGTLQALQAIHLITGCGEVLRRKLLIFDGSTFSFRSIKLRGRVASCVCGPEPKITQLIDYEQFCGAPAHDKNPNLSLLDPSERVTPVELLRELSSSVLIDVRSPNEFEIGSIPNSINIPLSDIQKPETLTTIKDILSNRSLDKLLVVCRRGNDSQIGVRQLKEVLGDEIRVMDIRGGLHAWSNTVDPNFPLY